MITIKVDEAYAFDFLAILEVKYSVSNNADILFQSEKCYEHILGQLGKKKMEEVYFSDEYKALVEANRKTFEWVDKAKKDDCKASDVDRANYERCKARNALQDKFFPAFKISEVKFGYEAYSSGNTGGKGEKAAE